MEKETKKPKSKARKVVDWFIGIFFGALIAAVGVFLIVGNATKGSNHNVPSFNGRQILIVLTDSMEPEYKVGTALFVEKVDPSSLIEGDDVTFFYPTWKKYMDNPVVTHRIREISIDETKEVGQGHYKFVVGGINTNSGNAEQTSGGKTRDCTKQHQDITEVDIMGVVRGQSPFFGGVYKFVTSPWGLVTLLFIPTGYLIISNMVDIVKAVKDEDEPVPAGAPSGESPSTSIEGLSDEDKERLKKELLQKMVEDKMDGLE